MGRKKRSRPAPEPLAAARANDTSRRWALALVLGMTFLAFCNSIVNGFTYDDNSQILKNELIRSFSNVPTALTREVWFWRVVQDEDPNKVERPTTPYYRPVFVLYLMAGWALFGPSPAGWHLVNVLMHLAGVLFVFLLIERLTRDLRLTTISTLLFAVHPLRSESVAWISGSTDLFLALFLLPSFHFYLLYRESGRQRHLIWSLGLFFLAAFSKEPAVALPVFILAYETLISNRRPFKTRLRDGAIYAAIYFTVSASYFIMRYFALGFVLSDDNYTKYPAHEVLLTIPIAVSKYLSLVVWPFNLSIFHHTPMVRSPLDLRFILPVLLISAIAVGLWRLRGSFTVRFASLWFAVHLLPVLNLSAFEEAFLIQERYLYIPSIGLSLLGGLALMRLPVERWLAVGSQVTARLAVVVVVIALLGVKAAAQNRVWEDEFTLWTHGTKVAADQPMSHFILGYHYLKLNRADKVVESLEKYLELEPENRVVISNLAAAHLLVFDATMDVNHVQRAIALAEKGIALNAENPALWDTLGRAYASETPLKNLTRAHALLDRGLKLHPQNAMLNFHKGAVYLYEGNVEFALHHLELARTQSPDLADTYKFLGYAYKNQGRLKEAADEFTRYLQLQPNARDAPKINQELQALTSTAASGPPQS